MNIEMNSGGSFVYLIMVLMVILGVIMPYVTRKDLFFGIRLEDKTLTVDEKKQILKSYLIKIIGIDLIIIAIGWFLRNTMMQEMQMVVMLLAILANQWIAYLAAHNHVKHIKESRPESDAEEAVYVALDEKVDGVNVSMISVLWFALPLALTVFMFFQTLSVYDQLPDQLPTRFDFSGNIIGFADKTYANAFALTITALLLTFLFVGVYYTIKYAKKQIDAKNPEESKAQVLKYRRIWSIWSVIASIIMIAMLYAINLVIIGKVEVTGLYVTVTSTAPVLLLIVSIMVVALYTGQGGSRIKTGATETFEKTNRKDDQFWKLGIFYVNKNDPAFLIEKRFGIGWTINFGNTKAVIGFIALLIIIALLSVFTG